MSITMCYCVIYSLYFKVINIMNTTVKDGINIDVELVSKIKTHFQMPIHYLANDDKIEVSSSIQKDLEWVETVDPSLCPVVSFCYNTREDNPFSKIIAAEKMSSHYTTNVDFLRDNQHLLQSYKCEHTSSDISAILATCREWKGGIGFKEKYGYIDWKILEWLNYSPFFLQCSSVFNLFSPVLSLLIPVLILIIPFFILHLKGIALTTSEYVTVLKHVASTNAIGKLFTTNYSAISSQEITYLCVSVFFYLFSIYQNITICVKFHENLRTIVEHFRKLHHYLGVTIKRMQNYSKYASVLKHSAHQSFGKHLMSQCVVLDEMRARLAPIVSRPHIYQYATFRDMGNLFSLFYELHTSAAFDAVLYYSFGLHGYLDCLEGLQQNLREKKMHFAILMKKNTKKNKMKGAYYACLKDQSPVCNNIDFKHTILLTGPNASGKTTVLKSALINVLMTQQYGCGFYETARMAPFRHLHCYLNIPDTSGRDSLFQAEARRCKEIIDVVRMYPKDTHFCVLDEIYSGTNPEEAEISAVSFVQYLHPFKQVSILLTTHFVKVCKKLDGVKGVQNQKMIVHSYSGEAWKYTYQIGRGISEIKGGAQILAQMEYPKEIMKKVRNYTSE